MRMLLVVLVLVVGCDARGKQCQKVLDTFLEKAPKHIEDALGVVDGAEKEKLRLQAGKEVAAMREKFVDACKKADKFDPDCFDDDREKAKPAADASPEEREKAEKRHQECRKQRDAIDKVVFAGL